MYSTLPMSIILKKYPAVWTKYNNINNNKIHYKSTIWFFIELFHHPPTTPSANFKLVTDSRLGMKICLDTLRSMKGNNPPSSFPSFQDAPWQYDDHCHWRH